MTPTFRTMSVIRSPSNPERLSFCWFAFWWFIIFSVYLATSVYNAAYARFYWNFDDTILSIVLEENMVGMDRNNNHTIAYFYISLAALHGLCAMLMLVGSLRHRSLIFSPWKSKAKVYSSNRTNKDNASSQSVVRRCYRVVPYLSMVYEKLAGRSGLLGVNGRHFDFIVICREILETILQTVQAFRMSKFLPRIVLNRFYVCLLAVNCWSPVFIYSDGSFMTKRADALRQSCVIASWTSCQL